MSDLLETPLPASCGDTLRLSRIIEIYDGDPSDPTVTPMTCIQNYVVAIPFNLRLVSGFPDETVVSCDADIQTEFENWVAAYGYTDIDSGCTAVMVDFTIPSDLALDDLDYLPGGFNPNGCGSASNPGNGLIRATFHLIDSCGHRVETLADFRVVDEEAPLITNCPPDLTIDLSDPTLFDSIQELLSSITAVDNCSPAVEFSHDFDPSQIDLATCDEQVMDITLSAEDQCANVSNCTATVTITNSGSLGIICPSPLFLNCGSPDNILLVQNWLAQASAVDGLGQAFPATNNFDLSILGNTICVLSTEVTFIATDNCGRSVSCQQNLQIEDSEPPRVDSCPDDLTVQADDPTLVNVVTNWLDVYSASDQCNSILLLQNDFDSSVLGAGCGSRVVEVIFTADDACFPIDSSCVSTLTIEDNVISSFTTLPEDIILECSTSPDLVTINAWLGQATAGNNLGQTFTVENNLDLTSMAFEMCGADIEVALSLIHI